MHRHLKLVKTRADLEREHMTELSMRGIAYARASLEEEALLAIPKPWYARLWKLISG